MSPSIEYTLSNATSLGRSAGYCAISRSRSAGSLCAKTCFGHPDCRIPAIIEAWFSASEKITQPSTSRASVDSVASLEI